MPIGQDDIAVVIGIASYIINFGCGFKEYPSVFDITYMQFSKRYVPTRTKPGSDKMFMPKNYEIGAEGLGDHSEISLYSDLMSNFSNVNHQFIHYTYQ